MARYTFGESDMNELLARVGVDDAGAAYARSFSDLDLDSLARVEISTRIKDRFGVEVDEERIAGLTPGHLVNFVNERLAAGHQGGGRHDDWSH